MYAYCLCVLVFIQSQSERMEMLAVLDMSPEIPYYIIHAESMETLAVLDRLIARFQEDFLLPDGSRTVRMLALEFVSQKGIHEE